MTSGPWPQKDVEREGYTWSVWVRENRDEQGWFSSAVAYRDWPFSAEVETNRKRAAILACNTIEPPGSRTRTAVSRQCADPPDWRRARLTTCARPRSPPRREARHPAGHGVAELVVRETVGVAQRGLLVGAHEGVHDDGDDDEVGEQRTSS